MKISKLIHHTKRLVFKYNQRRIDRILTAYSHAHASFFFIQIGSNDGISGDPLYPFITTFGWHGILIEPVRYLFEKLLDTHKGREGLFFENIAIAKEAGMKTFYRINAMTRLGFVPWYERAASLDKEHLLNHQRHIEKKRPFEMVEEDVQCYPFTHLLEKYAPPQIDLVHIDAEGHDYEIIKLIPFDEVLPRMIWYENKHLTPADKLACKRLLQSWGYWIIKSKDTFAYLPSVISQK